MKDINESYKVGKKNTRAPLVKKLANYKQTPQADLSSDKEKMKSPSSAWGLKDTLSISQTRNRRTFRIEIRLSEFIGSCVEEIICRLALLDLVGRLWNTSSRSVNGRRNHDPRAVEAHSGIGALDG